MKIGEFYHNLIDQLTEAQIEHPALNAEVLISFYFGWERTEFYLNQGQKLLPEDRLKIEELIARRIAREPLQYITGVQNFYGRDFEVGPGVLIPRPETELLVEAVLAEADAIWGAEPIEIVDIGTGSGVLAVTLALERPSWSVTAIDLSDAALTQAIANNERLGAGVKFLLGDLFSPLTEGADNLEASTQATSTQVSSNHAISAQTTDTQAPVEFNLIVSNPPYIESQDLAGLADEVRLHEPHTALDGGPDGLDYYRRLLAEGPPLLKRPGLIALEIGYGQAETLTDLVKKSGASDVKTIADFQDISRIIIAKYR